MTSNLRIDMFNNPNKYIGRVVEIRGKKMFKSGLLRHPAFNKFREDKQSKMCKFPII